MSLYETISYSANLYEKWRLVNIIFNFLVKKEYNGSKDSHFMIGLYYHGIIKGERK